jgi:hypothetical protein
MARFLIYEMMKEKPGLITSRRDIEHYTQIFR